MKIIPFLLGLLFFIQTLTVNGIAKMLFNNPEMQNTRQVNSNFWKLVDWYYGRSTFIALTIISEPNVSLDESSIPIIKELHASNKLNKSKSKNIYLKFIY